jgi:alanyl-tRNA synthetase
MLKLKYWDDPYRTEFRAEIVNVVVGADVVALELSETYFHPEGGGQRSDRGTINALPVTDVQFSGGDHRTVLHYLDAAHTNLEKIKPGQAAVCKIDWEYRLLNMRSHTGCHLIYGAARKLYRELGYAGFSITGDGTGTVYLNTSRSITSEDIHKLTQLSNMAMLEDLNITTYFVTPNEVTNIKNVVYNVKLPERDVRIVDINGWDVAVCSGTHFTRTIEVGPIAIICLKKHKKDVTRIDYAIGKNALDENMITHRAISKMSSFFNVNRNELVAHAEKLNNEVEEKTRQLKKVREKYSEYELLNSINNAVEIGTMRLVVVALRNVDQNAARSAASKLMKREARLVLCIVGESGRIFIVGAQSHDLDVNLASPIIQTAKKYGGGGGGRPHLITAGGLTGDVDTIVDDLQSTLLRNLAEV